MTNKKVTRRALVMSVTSLLICISMLLGTTFAWFTDEVTSGVNKIVAGNLDVEVYHKTRGTNADPGEAVNGATEMFNVSANDTSILWEPGAVSYEVFTVKNVGTLALKYQMTFINFDINTVYTAEGTDTGKSLLDVIRVKVLDGDSAPTDRPAFADSDPTLGEFANNGAQVFDSANAKLEPAQSKAMTVILYWPSDTETTGVTDNDYNLKNGAYASDSAKAKNTGEDVGQLYVSFGISLVATQVEHEYDSFDNTYDGSTTLPTVTVLTESVKNTVALNEQNKTDAAQTLTTPSGTAEVVVPAGVSYTASGSPDPVTGNITTTLHVEPGTSDPTVTVETSQSATTYEVSVTAVDEHNIAVTPTGEVQYTVTLDIGVVDLQKFYHKGVQLELVDDNVALVKDSNFHYNQTAGTVTFITTTFSPFTATYKFAGGIGTEKYPYLIANYEQMQAIEDCVGEYNYYKVKDGVTSIDCAESRIKGYVTQYLNGSFDGNGCYFKNLYGNLIYYAMAFNLDDNNENIAEYKLSEIKNLTADIDVRSTRNTGLVYYFYNVDSVTFENVTVHGYVEGYMASPYIGFYQGLNSSAHQDILTFTNCYSDATLVAKNERACGFVCNFYYGYGQIRINNSEYNGTQYSTGSFSYVHGFNNSNISIVFDEAAKTKAENHTSYNITAGVAFSSNQGATPKYDVDSTRAIPFANSSTAYELGNKVYVTAAEGATYAIVTLQIGGNTINKGGNFVGVYETETISEIVDGKFTTSSIEYCHCVVNPDGCNESASHLDSAAHYYHVHNSYYDANTCNAAFISIAQYDANDKVVSMTLINLPKN